MSSLSIKHQAWLAQGVILHSDQNRATLAPNEELSDIGQMLDQLLSQAPRGRLKSQDSLLILIGAPHIHYLVTPWQPGLVTETDRQSYARALFAEHFGVTTDTWFIWLENSAYGMPSLTAAIDTHLPDIFTELKKKHRLGWIHFRALLSEALQYCPKNMQKNSVLVVPQETSSSFAFKKEGIWQQAFTLPHAAGLAFSERLTIASNLAAQKTDAHYIAAPRDFSHLLPNAIWLDMPYSEINSLEEI